MAQKIQEFKSLDIPKTVSELIKVANEMRSVEKKIDNIIRKLRSLRYQLRKKERRNKFRRTEEMKNNINKREEELDRLRDKFRSLATAKQSIVEVKKNKNNRAREIFKNEIHELGLEKYYVYIKIDDRAINFYFRLKETSKKHGHYVIDFDGKLIYRRDLYKRHGSRNFVI